jgi:hypothetical protein
MANLTAAEQTHVATVVDRVVKHPEMQRHRSRFLKELGDTIGADYNDDRLAAEEEFQIAVWRAVVNLYYHRKYDFCCRACGSGHYQTKRGKPKAIDRQQIPCPNCGNVLIKTAGDTDLAVGTFVTHDTFQASYRDFMPGQVSPTCESCIDYISGNKIYEEPDKILEDSRQLAKFFGEFVWNYFRQTLRENSRVEHRKTPQKIFGPADRVIVEELLSLCARLKLDYNYCPHTQPEYGHYHIRIVGLQTPPEFSAEFAVLRDRARQHGVVINVDDIYIRVKIHTNAPNIEAFVVKPEHVLVLDNHASDTADADEGKTFTISQISYRTVGLERMQNDDHVGGIDNDDVMTAVRGALPDGDCQKVFDIFGGQGQVYLDFSEEFGDGKPCINHIARFLGITTRAVNQHKETIKVCCLANDFVPG